MGYHLSILRSNQGKQIPISLSEAVSIAQELEGWSYSENPPTFEYSCNEGTCTLWYQDGELWTKNPQEWELDVMLALASRLEARVRGDEWETYGAGSTFLHPDDVSLRVEAEAISKRLLSREIKQQTLICNVIVGFFVALGAVAFFVGKWLEQR
ncbi:MAG: hypothetical protein Q7K57_36885 [Burkholderiaceae bacterium]|nr:hypothetical protein [Burkholderiaceae bacterium]